QIAERIADPVEGDFGAPSHRPRLEPTRLVVNAFAGQKSLGSKAQYAAVSDEASNIVERVLIKERHPQRDDDSARAWQNLLQDLPRGLPCAGGVKGVLATVARNAQLRQAKHADMLVAGRFDRRQNVRLVALPGQR